VTEAVAGALQISEDRVRIVLSEIPRGHIGCGGIPPSKVNSTPVGKNYGTEESRPGKPEISEIP